MHSFACAGQTDDGGLQITIECLRDSSTPAHETLVTINLGAQIELLSLCAGSLAALDSTPLDLAGYLLCARVMSR